MRGILHYDPSTEAFTYDGLDVTVEGFDVGTGATTWSAGTAQKLWKIGVMTAQE